MTELKSALGLDPASQSAATHPPSAVDLKRLGPKLLVPFLARRPISASVLWLNERWFDERGIDLAVPGVRHAVSDWFVQNFAFCVPSPADPPGAYAGQATFFADRYGAPEGGWHGGSGRAASRDGFNLKGIGRTPLASEDASPNHRNGVMLLWEAVMEAVCAEVACAEFPHGAVPAVAIIDLGLSAEQATGRASERRALLIRPDFVRPAHMERSIFFGSSGFVGSDQHDDAIRVRDAVGNVVGLSPELGTTPAAFLQGVFTRAAEQVGFAHANRIWLGVFASSNRAIDGALVDFGAFRSVPTWYAHRTIAPEIFGNETARLGAEVFSLLFYFRKYSAPGEPLPSPPELHALIDQSRRAAFREACAAALRLDGKAADQAGLLDCLHAVFERHQRTFAPGDIDPAAAPPWLLDALMAPHPTIDGDVTALQQMLGAYDRDPRLRRLRRARLLHWLLPRNSISRSRLSHLIPGQIDRFNRHPDVRSGLVSRMIWRLVSSARRNWRDLPPTLRVRKQIQSGSSAAFVGQDVMTAEAGVLICGRATGDHLAAFGMQLDREAHSACSSDRATTWISARKLADPRYLRLQQVIRKAIDLDLELLRYGSRISN